MQRAAHAYLQTQVTTTSPGDILILLYDGAIKFLNQAKDFLAANDMAGKGLSISRTLDIINELDSTLNLDLGGDLAANLHNLYFFCSSRLVMANLKKDAGMIDEVIKILGGLRSAYAEIVALPEVQAAERAAAANMRPAACAPPRPQAGVSPSGGATPAPGANARIRDMHARNQRGAAEAEEAGTPGASGKASPFAAPSPAGIAPVSAPEQRTDSAQEAPAQRDFGGSAFTRRIGSDLYRKFAGQ